MKKIMFSERYGLEQAVLAGTKTMTRRIIPIDLYNQTDWKAVAEGDFEAVVDGEGYYHDIRNCGKYRVGEEVAIAQAYQTLRWPALPGIDWKAITDEVTHSKGWTNKMFVKAWYMPHRIRITGVKVERLQDISEEDCQREGIVPFTWRQWLEQDINDLSPQKYKDWDVWTLPKFIDGLSDPWKESDPDEYIAKEPRTAFAVLISKLMGIKTWEQNPWVYAYEFKLLKYRD